MSIAIICEGKNDQAFLSEFIDFLGFKSNAVNFYIFKGKSFIFKPDHPKYKKELLAELEEIDKILFVVDADYENKAFENTQKDLDQVINTLKLGDFSQTYIMCDPMAKIGYLESLILSTLEPEQKKCIECFLTCTGWKPEKGDKTVYHRLYKTGYPNPKHNFEHENFNDLKVKLTNLFKTE
jgi:hypothetical protein